MPIYGRNLERRGVELLRGWARLVSPQSVRVGDREISGKTMVLATGGRPLFPQLPGATQGISSDGFFELPNRPERVCIVGAGYVAAELAGIFSALGTRTTVVLRQECLLAAV